MEMLSDNKIINTFVIGHKNPDTDSIVSAYAYANLKQQQGFNQYIAKRAGNANAQTDFIFTNAGIKLPDLLPDLIPKVKYYANSNVSTFSANDSLWLAIKKMASEDLNEICLINDDRSYHSLLYYESFAFYILSQAKLSDRTSVKTSVNLIQKTLNAQVINLDNPNDIDTFFIFSSESYSSTFKTLLKPTNPKNLAVIMGDRFDLQEHVISLGCRLLIVSNGYLLDPKLKDSAIKNGVSVISSPYDSATTNMMLHYSIPAKDAANKKILPVYRNDTIKKVKPFLKNNPARALPVLNKDDKLVAILNESDLANEPNINVVLVDHNEYNQALEGIEHYHIKAVIDHHKIGGFYSKEAINFYVKIVGATSSIITSLYREQCVPISKEIALLLLGGIISDTINFKSATTTDFDKNMADYLAILAGLEIEDYANTIIRESSQNYNKTPKESITSDRKVYTENNLSFGVSQIETSNSEFHVNLKNDYIDELQKLNQSENLFFSSLLITDITSLTSYLIICGKDDFINSIAYPLLEENVYEMKNILSRKKQLLPFFISLIESY